MDKNIKNVYFEEDDNNKKNLIKPDFYFDSVVKITPEFLAKNNIKGLILDVDNTLIDIDKNLPQDIENWSKNLRGLGYRLHILSNTNDKKKVETVANKLDLNYDNLAKKPFTGGFLKVQKKLNLKNNQIAVVGDQLFTDVLGGNLAKMKTILVDPVDNRDYWYTAIKRPLENLIKNKFKKTNEV